MSRRGAGSGGKQDEFVLETVNNILVKMFKDILDIEERALITSEYKDISVNDMHIMEAIGIQEPKNMSTVAKAVSVTTGTLTIAINHLVKKGYVERTRSEEDRRVVLGFSVRERREGISSSQDFS